MPQRRPVWKIDPADEHTVQIVFQGEMNELFDGKELLAKLNQEAHTIRLECAGVRRVNSAGVRQWVNFVRELHADERKIEYIAASVPMVSQFNMIPAMTEHTRVRSIYAPFFCEKTNEEADRLLEVSEIDPANPPTSVEDGGETWELDEDPQRYFVFLQPLPD